MNMRTAADAVAPDSDTLPFVDVDTGSALPRRTRWAICVTAYNEDAAAVASTIASLRNSLRQARLGGLRTWGDAALCLLVDGVDAMAPDLLQHLLHEGWVTPEASLRDGRTRFFHSRPAGGSEGDSDLRVIVGIKGSNHGKLHSHALFFGRICVQLQPEICFQIDAGTTIAPLAIGAMLAQFEREADTAAVASRVTTPPSSDGSMLEGWQYMDFATQAAVAWRAEVLAGHLSVLPGQFSGLRWRAIAGTAIRVPFADERSLQAARHAPADDPLDRYLRGLAPARDFERVMFLAEDRVIGNELVVGTPIWKLGYCASAHAITDACETPGELLRQRRRWNNGSAACRLWLAARWPGEMRRSDLSWRAKLRLTIAVAWQLLLVAQQAIAPATLVCTLVLLGRAIGSALQHGAPEWPLALAVSLAIALGAGLWPHPPPWRAALRDVAFTAVLACVAILLAGILPASSLALLLLPPALAAAATARDQAPHQAVVLRRAAEHFVVVNPVAQACLTTYAVARLADTSWGTKGLTRRNARRSGVTSAALSLWLAINAALVAVAAAAPSFLLPGLDPVLEISALIFALSVAAALLPEQGRSRRPPFQVEGVTP